MNPITIYHVIKINKPMLTYLQQLNINIPSNPKKVIVDIHKKFNINISFNLKIVNVDIPIELNIIIPSNTKK